MSKLLAEQMADEWEFRVREYAKTHKSPFSWMLVDMIERDIRSCDKGVHNAKDVAKHACEILKERLAAQDSCLAMDSDATGFKA